MSVLVDTNVVSELIRKSPEPAVAGWAAAHDLEELFFSAVGEAELRHGAAILAVGRRRETLVADNRTISVRFVSTTESSRSTALRLAPTRRLQPGAVPPDGPPSLRTAKSRRSPAPAA